MTVKIQFKRAYSLFREEARLQFETKYQTERERQIREELDQIPSAIRAAAWAAWTVIYNGHIDMILQRHGWEFQEDYDQFKQAIESHKLYGNKYSGEHLRIVRVWRYYRNRRHQGRKYQRRIP